MIAMFALTALAIGIFMLVYSGIKDYQRMHPKPPHLGHKWVAFHYQEFKCKTCNFVVVCDHTSMRYIAGKRLKLADADIVAFIADSSSNRIPSCDEVLMDEALG